MEKAKGPEFSWVEGLAICLSMIGVQLCSEVINQWGLYFYSPSGGVGRTIYVSVGMVGIIFIIGTVWDAFSSPVIGMLSDGTSTRPGRWRLIPIPGRRLPYIFWGGVLMVFTMIGFWYPPVNGTSWLNLAYGTVLLCTHWTLFSLAVVPLTALGPEIARSDAARVAIGTWTAIGMILGLALANALPGVLIAAMDPGRVESSLAVRMDKADGDQARQIAARLFSAAPDLAGKTQKDAAGIRLDGFEPGDITLATDGDKTVLTVKGTLYDRLREETAAAAIRGLIPEALRDKYTPVTRKAWYGAEFRDGALSAELVEHVRAEALAPLTASMDREAEFGAAGSTAAITFPTLMAERMDETALQAVAARIPGVTGDARATLGPGFVRYDLPQDVKELPAGARAYLADATAREALRSNLIQLGADGPTRTLVFPKALRSDLTIAHLRGVMGGVPGVAALERREESFSPAGYRRVSTIFAFLSLLLFMLPVIFVRERYDSEAVQSEPLPYGRAVLDALRNKPFMIYAFSFFFFTIGFLAVQRALPYWAELGLDGDEGTITKLLAPFILIAVVSYAFIPILARHLHMKWLIFIALTIIASGMPCMYFIGQSNASFATRQIWGMILFGYCGVGQALMYVMMVPMIGDIIDYDERLSGERREALYNGLSAFIWKASMAGSVLLASQSMNLWGNRIEQYTGVLLVGPFAGLFGLIGMVLICFYPVHKAERNEGMGKR
jgi:Na+/melibiose symporter-like transporter